MNGFVYNSLRRAKMSLVRKVYFGAVAMIRPDIVKSEWRKHCIRMQNELNEEHYFERKWYVARGHELCEL